MKRNAFLIAAALSVVTFFNSETIDAQDHGEHAGPVMNYHRIDERLVTGGHVVGDGLAELQAEGVTVIIDLREDPPRGQKDRLADRGIEWINIPVEWSDPKSEDFDRFSEAMQAHRNDHVLVQCAANYRASAMTYLYRVAIENVDESEAGEDLYAVWNPGEESRTWSDYIEEILAEK